MGQFEGTPAPREELASPLSRELMRLFAIAFTAIAAIADLRAAGSRFRMWLCANGAMTVEHDLCKDMTLVTLLKMSVPPVRRYAGSAFGVVLPIAGATGHSASTTAFTPARRRSSC